MDDHKITYKVKAGLNCSNTYLRVSFSQKTFSNHKTVKLVLNITDVDTDMPGPPEEDDFANCDPPYFGNEEAQTVPENFVRMGPNSKYFIGLTSIVEVDEVAQFCEGIGLQSAEIRNHLELLSIDSFLEGIYLTAFIRADF